MVKIAALGDSITYGYPYGPSHSWLAQVGEKLKVETYNHGVNGELTSEILNRVVDVIEEEADVVIIMGGTNDAYDQLSVHTVIINLKKMIAKLRESQQVEHIFIGIPPIVVGTGTEQLLDSYRLGMKKLAQEESIAVIDFNKALSSMGLNCLVDSCHPNKIGYEKMAEVACEEIVSKVEGL